MARPRVREGCAGANTQFMRRRDARACACVLSALAREDRPSPPALRRALESTCKPVPSADPFAQGFGLIDAPAAVSYLETHAGKTAHDLAFEVTVPSQGDARGVYLRDAGQVLSPAAQMPLREGVEPHSEQFDLKRLRAMDVDWRDVARMLEPSSEFVRSVFLR